MNAVIEEFAETSELTVTREATGSFVAGQWTPGATSQFTITAAVVPMTMEEIELLNAGREVKEALEVFTTTELKTASEASQTNSDVVSYDSKSYEIHSVEYWGQISDLAHYRAVALYKDA